MDDLTGVDSTTISSCTLSQSMQYLIWDAHEFSLSIGNCCPTCISSRAGAIVWFRSSRYDGGRLLYTCLKTIAEADAVLYKYVLICLAESRASYCNNDD